jgi:hypothetical protein
VQHATFSSGQVLTQPNASLVLAHSPQLVRCVSGSGSEPCFGCLHVSVLWRRCAFGSMVRSCATATLVIQQWLVCLRYATVPAPAAAVHPVQHTMWHVRACRSHTTHKSCYALNSKILIIMRLCSAAGSISVPSLCAGHMLKGQGPGVGCVSSRMLIRVSLGVPVSAQAWRLLLLS